MAKAQLSRRACLDDTVAFATWIAAAGKVSALTGCTFLGGLPLFAAAVGRRLTKEKDQFLEDLSHRSFLFFWEQADPGTGLVRDRALADSDAPDQRATASSAATGFGLTGLCIASERGWISRAQARERILATLRFYAECLPARVFPRAFCSNAHYHSSLPQQLGRFEICS